MQSYSMQYQVHDYDISILLQLIDIYNNIVALNVSLPSLCSNAID